MRSIDQGNNMAGHNGATPHEQSQQTQFPDLAQEALSTLRQVRIAHEANSQRSASPREGLQRFLESLPRDPAVLEVFKLLEMVSIPSAALGTVVTTSNHRELKIPYRPAFTILISEQTRHHSGDIRIKERPNLAPRHVAQELLALEQTTSDIDQHTAARRLIDTIQGYLVGAKVEFLNLIEELATNLGDLSVPLEEMRRKWSDNFCGKLDDDISYDAVPEEMQRAARIVHIYTQRHQDSRTSLKKLLEELPTDPTIKAMFETVSMLRQMPEAFPNSSSFRLQAKDSIIIPLPVCADSMLAIQPTELLLVRVSQRREDNSPLRWKVVEAPGRAEPARGTHTAPSESPPASEFILRELLSDYGRHVYQNTTELVALNEIREAILKGLTRQFRRLQEIAQAAVQRSKDEEAMSPATALQPPRVSEDYKPTRFRFVNVSPKHDTMG